MNELLKVDYSNDTPLVSGRELHEFLQVGTAYKDWFPRMCEYGFTQGTDFNPLKIERVQIEGARKVSRIVEDHALTISMAKELCMIQRTERGKQARQYFIGLERKWNTPEQIMARALQMANKAIESLKSENIGLINQIEVNKPKVLLADNITASDDSILVKELAHLMQQNGFKTGQNRLFELLQNDGYLCSTKGERWNLPTQRAMDAKLFEVEECCIVRNGDIEVVNTTKVTGKGIAYFLDKYVSDKVEAK